MAKGDHLRVYRLGYWHHGIDVGDNKVVHFATPGKRGVEAVLTEKAIGLTSRRTFARGQEVQVVLHAIRTYSPTEIARRARSKIGSSNYQLLRNNCEHFANWCVHGTKKSDQVDLVPIPSVRVGRQRYTFTLPPRNAGYDDLNPRYRRLLEDAETRGGAAVGAFARRLRGETTRTSRNVSEAGKRVGRQVSKRASRATRDAATWSRKTARVAKKNVTRAVRQTERQVTRTARDVVREAKAAARAVSSWFT